jgi:hypothetical protein
MGDRGRNLTILSLAGYLLAVTTSAFFHAHGAEADEHASAGFWASHESDSHGCRVCEFEAQKPAPVTPVTPAVTATLVAEVPPSNPPAALLAVFSAWQSRAPPIGA